jgi:hypothetical protein
VVIPYRSFGTTYRPHVQGATGCPETSVRNYHYSLSNNPEDRSSHLLRGGSLKSGIAMRSLKKFKKNLKIKVK